VKENPEIMALKQEIASLESTLKASQQNIAYQNEKLEQYSKAGYARKVAEMETMRRARSVCCKQECVWNTCLHKVRFDCSHTRILYSIHYVSASQFVFSRSSSRFRVAKFLAGTG
jgi:hypothetical protein